MSKHVAYTVRSGSEPIAERQRFWTSAGDAGRYFATTVIDAGQSVSLFLLDRDGGWRLEETRSRSPAEPKPKRTRKRSTR
jgi:hypothetical protein